MNLHESLPDLSGLEQLRALIASGKRPPIAETLDFNLAEVDEGRAVFVATPNPRAYNPIGSVHGGYAATLLDSACGCAVHSLLTSKQADTALEVEASGLWPGKVVTELAPAGPFWEAEPAHQDYLLMHPGGYTCHFIRPNWRLPVRAKAAPVSAGASG
jgi:uncharacterized protein (TIGR00369 family)